MCPCFAFIKEVGVEVWGQCLDKKQSEYQKQGLRLWDHGASQHQDRLLHCEQGLPPEAGVPCVRGEEGGGRDVRSKCEKSFWAHFTNTKTTCYFFFPVFSSFCLFHSFPESEN